MSYIQQINAINSCIVSQFEQSEPLSEDVARIALPILRQVASDINPESAVDLLHKIRTIHADRRVASSESIAEVTHQLCDWLRAHPGVQVKSLHDLVYFATSLCKNINLESADREQALCDFLGFFEKYGEHISLRELGGISLFIHYDENVTRAITAADRILSSLREHGIELTKSGDVSRLLCACCKLAERKSNLKTEMVLSFFTSALEYKESTKIINAYAHVINKRFFFGDSNLFSLLNSFYFFIQEASEELVLKMNIMRLGDVIGDLIEYSKMEEAEIRSIVPHCMRLIEALLASSSRDELIEIVASIPSTSLGQVAQFFMRSKDLFSSPEIEATRKTLIDLLHIARAFPEAQRGEMLKMSLPLLEEMRDEMEIDVQLVPDWLLDALRGALATSPRTADVVAKATMFIVALLNAIDQTRTPDDCSSLGLPNALFSKQILEYVAALLNDIFPVNKEKIKYYLSILKALTAWFPAVALMTCDEELQFLYPPNAKTYEHVRLCVLAHIARFDTDDDKESRIQGEVMGLMGSYFPIMYDAIIQSLEEFSFEQFAGLDKKKKDILLNALTNAKCMSRTVQSIIEELKTQRLSIVPVAYEGHTVALVFYKDSKGDLYYAVCNTGDGLADDGETITVFKSMRQDVDGALEDFLKRIVKPKFRTTDAYYNYIYNEGPGALGCSTTNRTLSIERISPKLQKSDTCALASSKTAFRCGMAFLALDGQSDANVARILDGVVLGYKAFSEHFLEFNIEHFSEFNIEEYEDAHRQGAEEVEKSDDLVDFARGKLPKKHEATERARSGV